MPQSPHPPCLATGKWGQRPEVWWHRDRGLSRGKIYGLSNVSTPGPGDGHGETTVTPHDLLFPEHGGLSSESCWCHGAPGSGLDVREMRPSPAPSPRAHVAQMSPPPPKYPTRGKGAGWPPHLPALGQLGASRGHKGGVGGGPLHAGWSPAQQPCSLLGILFGVSGFRGEASSPHGTPNLRPRPKPKRGPTRTGNTLPPGGAGTSPGLGWAPAGPAPEEPRP